MKICEAGRSSGCCSNPNIRTINTMSADTVGNFEIRAGAGVAITTETNGIRISYTGGLIAYTNTDGNLDIDNVNFTIDLANDIVISGDLTVNGTYYTVHAEHVYTEDDYIIMRDGAVTGLGSGDFSGFQVKLYDGVNDGRLVIDNAGVARVGDVGDEQPLLTREEAANLNDGALLKWDAGNSKAVDEGTVGTDTKPIKIVNGVATAITNDLMTVVISTGNGTYSSNVTIHDGHNAHWVRCGKICIASFDVTMADTAATQGTYKLITIATGLPNAINELDDSSMWPRSAGIVSVDGADGNAGWCYVDKYGSLILVVRNLAVNAKIVMGSITYICQ